MRTDYRKEILNLTEELPVSKLREVLDFINVLRAKDRGFSYKEVNNSVAYVQEMRSKKAEHVKSGKEFIEELIRWQESNSL